MLGFFPGVLSAQVVYTANSNSGGTWQSGIWSMTPSGGPAFPNNNLSSEFKVNITGNYSYDLNANVTINSLASSSGFTLQNAAGRTLKILDGLTVNGGSLATQSAVHLDVDGTSVFNGLLDLKNGATIRNRGALTVGSAAVTVTAPTYGAIPQTVSVEPFGVTYGFVNSGTVVFNRPGDSQLQNFHVMNDGLWQVSQGKLRAETFSQTNATSVFRVLKGATLEANNLDFQGGVVLATGSTLNGANYKFRNTVLVLGEGLTDIANLTLAGNASGSDAWAGATVRFLINGGDPGQYDTLTINNGGNAFGGLTLHPVALNYTIKNSDVFTIVTGNNLRTGSTPLFLNQVGGTLDVPGLGTFDVNSTGTSVVLSGFVPVPEPGEMAAVAGVALVGFGLWRVRRPRPDA